MKEILIMQSQSLTLSRRSEKQHDERKSRRGRQTGSELLSNKKNLVGKRQKRVQRLSGWNESDKQWKILRKWRSGKRSNSGGLKMLAE
jgi:hypothetical protein